MYKALEALPGTINPISPLADITYRGNLYTEDSHNSLKGVSSFVSIELPVHAEIPQAPQLQHGQH